MAIYNFSGDDVATMYPPSLDTRFYGYAQDPFVSAEIDRALDEAELMGYDLDDPEVMGAWLKNLVNKIKSKFKKKNGGTPTSLSLTTSQGTAQLGPEGVSWTNPVSAATPSAAPAATGAMALLKNPVVLAGAGAVVLLVLMRKKKGRR
jgi:hypothetical protein